MHELYDSMGIILLVGTSIGPSLTSDSILGIAEDLGTQYIALPKSSLTC